MNSAQKKWYEKKTRLSKAARDALEKGQMEFFMALGLKVIAAQSINSEETKIETLIQQVRENA
jgi:hypothetical protein